MPGNVISIENNGVFVPNGYSLPADKIRAVSWDLYGVIHPDEEVLSQLYGEDFKGSPTVVSQSKLISALLDGKDLRAIEMDIFGPSSGEALSAPLKQVDFSQMTPSYFIKHYLMTHGMKPKDAAKESRYFVRNYVRDLAITIDRRILDGLIPELRRIGVLSQIITDRTVLALAIAKMVPDYLTKRRFPLGIVSSQQVKMHKPDSAIYREGLELSAFHFGKSFTPAQAVMIDDRDYNLIGTKENNFTDGAINAGMYGIRYKGYEMLLDAFWDLGIKHNLKREV
jgi:FMN phosphatase YigB (HAD superfamily)